MSKLKYDNHHIEEQFLRIKAILIAAEKDMENFLGPTKNREAARRFSIAITKVRRYTKFLRKSISNQRNEYKSEY